MKRENINSKIKANFITRHNIYVYACIYILNIHECNVSTHVFYLQIFNVSLHTHNIHTLRCLNYENINVICAIDVGEILTLKYILLNHPLQNQTPPKKTKWT